jgi:hypothetical protein
MPDYDKLFNIGYDRLIMESIPGFKRKPVTFAWLRALCSPFILLYNRLQVRRAADLYNLVHDGRVFSLRAVLNDRFDTVGRRISIADAFAFDRTFIFRTDENKPLYTGTVALHNPGDYGDTGVDFIVNVPSSVPLSTQDLVEMNALVKYYKLAGKRFLIYRTI